MIRFRFSAVPATVAGLALLSLTACEQFPKFAFAPHVKAIPMDMPKNSTETAEDRLYAQAAKAIGRREYDTALDALQMARESRPDDPRVLNALGVIYDKLGRFDLSERYYDLAEKADPGSKVVAMNRRYSQMMQQAAPTLAPDQVMAITTVAATPVVADKTAAVRVAPVVAAARDVTTSVVRAPAARPAPLSEGELYHRAVAAIQRKAYGVALGNLKSAQALAPHDPRVLSAMGVVYDWLGRFDLSTHYYDLAEAADPGSPVVAINRRYSKILQQHGGALVGDQVVTPEDTVARTAVATNTRSAGGQTRTAQRAPMHKGSAREAPAG